MTQVISTVMQFLVAGFGIFWAIHLIILVKLDEDFDSQKVFLLMLASLIISGCLYLSSVSL